ncbi:MAG: hypothetical protein ACO1OB_20600 [Archangium sp.]
MAECPKHPGVEAVGACSRCGRFFCAAEAKRIEFKTYCEECAARAEIDWLGKHYAKLEGKRSGLAWFLLVVGIGLIGFGTFTAIDASSASQRFFGFALLSWGIACASVFSGRPLTRWTQMAMAPVVGFFVFLSSGQEFAGVLTTCCLWLFAGMTLTDLRTRLFFRVPVERAALARHYERYGNNPLAVVASRLAFISLVVPGMSLLALVLGGIALSRVNRKAVPPVGSIGTALGAIAFSVFTSALWIMWLGRL